MLGKRSESLPTKETTNNSGVWRGGQVGGTIEDLSTIIMTSCTTKSKVKKIK